MSSIKVPSWLELISSPSKKKTAQKSGSLQEIFWKEQALRFGYDTRAIMDDNRLENPWQSFLFEKTLEYSLKGVNWKFDFLKKNEQAFWTTNGHLIEKLEIESTSLTEQDIAAILQILPHVKMVSFIKCELLFNTNSNLLLASLEQLKLLESFTIKDVHTLRGNFLKHLPLNLTHIQILRCRSFSDDFFSDLDELSNLANLEIRYCPNLRSNHLECIPSRSFISRPYWIF